LGIHVADVRIERYDAINDEMIVRVSWD
jgi:hypothetical protein